MDPYQVLPLQTKVDLGVMAIKWYSTFPKLLHYWNFINLFIVISRTLVGWFYPSAEVQSVNSTAPVDWARGGRINRLHLCRGVRTSLRVSWIRHKSIWWWGSSPGALGNAKYRLIAIASKSILTQFGCTW